MAQSNLEPTLQDMATYLEELRRVLIEEYEALSANDLAAIQQAADTKARLSEILDDLEQVRQTRLRDAGLEPGRSGLLNYLDRHFESRREILTTLWGKIEELGRECNRLNRINGIVIEKNRRRTETALSILQGKPRHTEYYSAEGGSVAATVSQSLAKA